MILTEEQVRNLAKPIFEQLKKVPRDKRYTNLTQKIKACPEYYPTYRLCVEYAERIKVHSEIGDFPEHLFISHSPNQTEKEYEYMKNNFKQITLPVFIDFDAANKRCFNDGNWNIYYPADEEEFVNAGQTFQDYVEKGIKDFGSLEDYVKFYLATQKSVDANGVVAVKPVVIPTIEDEETGEIFLDDSQLLEPQPFFYPSKQVLSDSKNDSKYIIVESHEKSEVSFNGKTEQMGYVLEIYDKENIWRVYQTGKYVDYTFDVVVYFNHGEGVIPACRLQGIPQMVNESIVWQSPFLMACPALDRALVNSNYLQCTVATMLFPYRIALGDECEFRFTNNDESGTVSICEAGQIRDVVSGTYRNCPACHGSGLKSRFSQVGGTMIIKAKSQTSEGDAGFTGKALEFVGPETNTSQFTRDFIKDDIGSAYDVIHVKRTSQANGTGISGDGTATSSILDLKTMYASIKIFSDQIFGKYEFINNRIGWQRYGDFFNPPVISYPVSFDFNTEEDYLKQIAAAYAAHLPTPVIVEIIMKYLRSLYYNEKQSQRVFDLIVASDRLFVLSQDEAMAKSRVGLAEKWEVILHDSSFQFIDELIDEYASTEICADDDCSRGFFALDFDEQKTLLVEKAKNKAIEISGATVTNGLLPNGAIATGDDLGKIPLALQQIALARERARVSGDLKLAGQLGDKSEELLKQI